MIRCDLALGPDPWDRLAAGAVTGKLLWDRRGPYPVTVQIRGAHSRRYPKRSLQVTLARGHRLPDPPPPSHGIRRLHLNADYIDPTLMRSSLSFGLHTAAGVPAPRANHAAVYINDQFAGVYVALESVDRDFCRRRQWEPGHIFYAVNRAANFGLASPFSRSLKEPLTVGYQAIQGADPGRLNDLLMELNLASSSEFPSVIRQWLDVDGYLNWLMVAVFVGNRDGFVHNYALYQGASGGPFRIIPWDYDATWGINIHGDVARLDRVPVTGWNKLTSRLMEVPAYRQQYREQFLAALESRLHPDALAADIDTMAGAIRRWVNRDRQRRQEPFDDAVDRLKWWAVERGALLRKELARL